VEHHPAREEHRSQRQDDREEREPDELKANGGEEAQRKGHGQANCQRRQGDEDCELDHGANR
jgi:hypothetical protein